jgi:hypothetical protein
MGEKNRFWKSLTVCVCRRTASSPLALECPHLPYPIPTPTKTLVSSRHPGVLEADSDAVFFCGFEMRLLSLLPKLVSNLNLWA